MATKSIIKNIEIKDKESTQIQSVKIGNRNKTGKCGMCGIKVEKLYPQTVGQVEFMICENCKSIMGM